jgi:hypothetical protein
MTFDLYSHLFDDIEVADMEKIEAAIRAWQGPCDMTATWGQKDSLYQLTFEVL